LGRFVIATNTETVLSRYQQPGDFVSEHTAILRFSSESGNEVCEAGELHAYRIHADRALEHGKSLLDVYDAYAQKLHNAYAAVYDPTTDAFTQATVEQFAPLDSDCLVLDYVVLHPRWRGLKLGLLAVRQFVDLVGCGCGLTVAEMVPLTVAHASARIPTGWLPPHESRETRKEATRKLRRHFRQMGFERIGRTPYYGLPMARQTPREYRDMPFCS
jgi:hypothetical protein